MRENGERTRKSVRNLTPCRGQMEAKWTGSVLDWGGGQPMEGLLRPLGSHRTCQPSNNPSCLRTEPAFTSQLVSSSRPSSSRPSRLLATDYYIVAQMACTPLRSYQLLASRTFWDDVFVTIWYSRSQFYYLHVLWDIIDATGSQVIQLSLAKISSQSCSIFLCSFRRRQKQSMSNLCTQCCCFDFKSNFFFKSSVKCRCCFCEAMF